MTGVETIFLAAMLKAIIQAGYKRLTGKPLIG